MNYKAVLICCYRRCILRDKTKWRGECDMKHILVKRKMIIVASIMMLIGILVPNSQCQAASYAGDYRYWSQGGSDYQGMREVGCLITAQAKMLYEANVNRAASFNPDSWYNWLLSNGGIVSSTNLTMQDHNAPATYAVSIGKNLTYLGYWDADDSQLWFNINAGYYTIVHVSGTNTGGSHYVLLDNALSKETGTLYCYDSFSDRGSVQPQLLSRYSIHNGGHVYMGNNTHTHSYSSSITKQPTCTATGVRTYTCSCGSSYTETIPAKGHSYKNQVIAPTLTEKGYTLHTCSVCGDSYKDTYVNPPELNSDGWYYSNTLPSGIATDKYTIEYNNYYEKIQANSPGSDWTNAATVKNEWQNSGGQYTSETDLPTSDSRILVGSFYYHFCGPNAGAAGNYDLTGNYVHYDSIDATKVIPTYCGVDNGHPYYVLDWIDGGGRVWCQSGVTCDGSYGTHGERCKAWYKMNTYQDRVKVVQYKFTKNSGWVKTKDASATSVKVRFKSVESEPPKPETPETGTDEDTKGDTENNADNKQDDNDSITEDGTDDDTDVIESVSLKGISNKIAAGKKIKLSATIVPADAANQKLTWKSSNVKYATVSSNGLVTTKKKGAGKTVTISAATKDGSDIVATYKIKIVKHAVKSVKITAKSKTVKAGKKLSLKAHVKTTGKTANKTLTWTSSNEKYATVSKKGVVKTTKQGKGKTVKITAKATDGTGKKAVVKIRIK